MWSTTAVRIVGLDVGTVRTGIAVTDELGITAQPVDVVKSTVADVADIVRRLGAERVVAGLPLDMRGETGKQARRVLAFLDRLGEALDIPIETWDERFSTVLAERVLLEADVRRSRRKQVRDKLSASIILQSWLEAHPRLPESP